MITSLSSSSRSSGVCASFNALCASASACRAFLGLVAFYGFPAHVQRRRRARRAVVRVVVVTFRDLRVQRRRELQEARPVFPAALHERRGARPLCEPATARARAVRDERVPQIRGRDVVSSTPRGEEVERRRRAQASSKSCTHVVASSAS